MPIADVDRRVFKIVDLKTPGSGEIARNLYDNIPLLLPHDEIKFVICDRRDYDWCCMKMDELQLADKVAEILFSPSQGELAPKQLAEWMLQDKLNVRMQLQTHKYIWGDQPGH
jgi:7-carboxy-7-deazaguanine synthase